MKYNISKKYKIAVCADGFVSIYAVFPGSPLKRRLGAALPFYSVDDMFDALELIREICHLKPCARPGKAGTSIEPKAPGWPADYAEFEPDASEELERLGKIFYEVHQRMLAGEKV